MLIFWIGTVAELIKVFTVIIEAKKRKIPCFVIGTGQNNLIDTDVLKSCNDNELELLLSDPASIKKSAFGLLMWFFKTYTCAKHEFKKLIKTGNINTKNAIMIVHGDTVSTLMGALIAKKSGIKLAHIEAGLRSFDLLHPFPEEIDRILTSKRVDYHFCPGAVAERNLYKAKVSGTIINTAHNTIYDGLQFANTRPFNTGLKTEIEKIQGAYFVFVMHRQENVANTALFTKTIEKIIQAAQSVHCVFILHEITRLALERSDLLKKVSNERFTLLPRVEYFDFMKILHGAEFVITDGGSNQEELAYMGKPCLIMRTKTERQDGIGKNAVLCNNDFTVFDTFIAQYTSYKQDPIAVSDSPSVCIVEKLQNCLHREVNK